MSRSFLSVVPGPVRAAVALSAVLVVGLPAFLSAQEGPDDNPFRRFEFFRSERAYPFDEIPEGALQRARDAMLARWPSEAARPTPSGPAGAPAQTPWAPIGPENIPISISSGGRISTVAVHPTDTSTIYIGGAQGGVWKSTDFGTMWSPMTDGECSLAMGSIAIDPASPDIVYAGTGELHFSGDSYYGCGLLRSTDGGSTWTHLGASVWDTDRGGARIARVVIDRATAGTASATTVLVASSSGIHRSTDSGQTWTKQADGAFTELLQHPTVDSVFFAGAGSAFDDARNGIYRSDDGGVTWAKLDTASGLPAADSAGRVQMDLAPSNPDIGYAIFQDNFNGVGNDGQILGIWKTTDGGATWSEAGAQGASCGRQCWYDLDIAVDPTDENTVYQGGVFLWKSTDGAATFDDIRTDDVTGDRIHVDQHNFAFDPQDPERLYVANDGGIYRTEDGGSTWSSLNTNLAITQFYSGISLHPTDTTDVLGGTQDNGTLNFDGGPTWNHVLGGDGGFTAIDFDEPTTRWAETQWSRNSGFSGPRKSIDGGRFERKMNGIDPNDNALFIPPLVMSPIDPDVLYFGTVNLYRTVDEGMVWDTISDSTFDSVGPISAIGPSAADEGTVWAGASGRVFVTRDADAAEPGWSRVGDGTLPVRTVKDFAPDPLDADIAWVVYSGFGEPHVWRTVDGGATWEDRSGDLPDVPVNAIAVHPEDRNLAFVGTDLGNFRTDDGGQTWTPFNDGFPNVAVFDLAFNLNTGWLVAGTHGRGMFRAQVAPPRFIVSGEVAYYRDARPVPDVALDAVGGGGASAKTDADGIFELDGLESGDTVSVTPAKSGDAAGAVTALDAATVLRCAAQIETCAGGRAVTGDVSDDGSVSSMDASLILQKVVGLIADFPAGEWVFDPPEIRYEPLSQSQLGQDFEAFLVGDVTGNWSAGGGAELLARAGGGEDGVRTAGSGEVATPRRAGGPARPAADEDEGDGAAVTVSRVSSGEGPTWALRGRLPGGTIAAAEATLGYDPAQWRVEAVTAGSDAREAVVVHRDDPAGAAGGRLLVALAGREGIAEEGELVRVRLAPTGDGGAGGEPFRLLSALLNETVVKAPGDEGDGERPLADRIPRRLRHAPENFGLRQNFPNPFTGASGTRLEVEVPADAPPGVERRVRVRVFDVLGRPVRTLWEGELPPGTHGIEWDGTDDAGRTVASGVYLAVAERDGERRRVRMIFVR